MSIDMSRFFPSQRMWPALKWLGGHDWLRTVVQPGFASTMEIDRRILLDPLASQHQELLHILLEKSSLLSSKDRGDFITGVYIGSRAFAQGPKMFGPAFETCLALEQVDLNFPWSEFRLPYATLIVQYPKDWAGRLRQAYGMKHTPVAAMIGQVGPDQVHLWVRFAEGGELHGILSNRPEYETVEDVMVSHENHGRRTSSSSGNLAVSQGEEILKRVTVNLAVLLSHCGTKELGWADPEGRLRNERKRSRRGDVLVLGDLVRVGPAEPIKVFAVTRLQGESEVLGGTHNSPQPHWRRGHWRMQSYGEGRSLRRQVFIAPVLVCGGRDGIDPSEYPVRYEEAR